MKFPDNISSVVLLDLSMPILDGTFVERDCYYRTLLLTTLL